MHNTYIMELDGVKYYLKAMNCPHHHKIFANDQKSYKDLPLRLAEYGTCYRYEQSGELFGLMRVRCLHMKKLPGYFLVLFSLIFTPAGSRKNIPPYLHQMLWRCFFILK